MKKNLLKLAMIGLSAGICISAAMGPGNGRKFFEKDVAQGWDQQDDSTGGFYSDEYDSEPNNNTYNKSNSPSASDQKQKATKKSKTKSKDKSREATKEMKKNQEQSKNMETKRKSAAARVVEGH